jgi:hypothetical protein
MEGGLDVGLRKDFELHFGRTLHVRLVLISILFSLGMVCGLIELHDTDMSILIGC